MFRKVWDEGLLRRSILTPFAMRMSALMTRAVLTKTAPLSSILMSTSSPVKVDRFVLLRTVL